MELDIGILLAIVTMLSWGIADFFAKQAIDKIGYKLSLLLNQAVALGPVIICGVLFFQPLNFSVSLFLTLIIVVVSGVIGWVYLYKGFQKGKVSIVSPISASWSVITVLLAMFLFEEKLTLLQVIGITLVFIGVFFTSTNLTDLKNSIRQGKSDGVFESLISMIAWGIAYAFIKPVTIEIGPIMAFVLLRGIAFSAMLCWNAISKTRISIPRSIVLVFILIAGLLDFLAFVALNLSLEISSTSITVPIAATYPAVTVLLASKFLREKLVFNQKLGIVAVLTGLAFISFT
jgi:transporter family protein